LLQEIQIGFGFTFLVPAYPDSPGQNPESHKMVVVVVVYDRELTVYMTINDLNAILSDEYSSRNNGSHMLYNCCNLFLR